MPDQHSTATWTSLPLALAPRTERLVGADHEAMLYVAADDRYIRLSRGAARLLDALDGDTTAAQILDRVGDEHRGGVLAALDALRQAGAFTLSRGGDGAAAPGPLRRFLERAPRVRIRRGIEPLVALPASLALRLPRLSRCVLGLVALASAVALVAGLAQFPGTIVVMWPAAIAVLALEVCVHELAHATVCRVYGLRVREAGVMLWGWFLPLAYVDCTDIYRLPGRRARIAVALAGPFVDLSVAGAAAAVALATRGETSGTAFMVVLTLSFVLARNLTPLLPTDGYQALEAATGELNLRHRSWLALCAWARRLRPGARAAVPAPSGRAARRSAYVAYGLVSVLYTAAMFGLVAAELSAAAGALGA